MKKSALSLMTLLVVTFFMSVSMTSCSDDDEEVDSNAAKEILLSKTIL